jgi:two-component system sensor histidine kinase VicK
MLATGTFIIYALRLNAASDAADELGHIAFDIRLNVIDDARRTAGNIDLSDSASRQEFEDLFEALFNNIVAGRMPVGTEAYILGNHPHPQQIHPHGHDEAIFNTAVNSALRGIPYFAPFRFYPDQMGNEIRWFVYAHPVFLIDDEIPDYVIYLRMSAEDFLLGLEGTTTIIIFGGLIALGAATLLSVAFSIPLTKNLLFLNKQILSYKIGDEPIKLLGSKDEAGQLAEGFNTMSQDLNKTVATISNEKNKMEIVMYNMTDGVLAYDASGVLIHSNYTCEELLGLDNIRALSMEELFKILDIEMPAAGNLDSIEDTIIGRGEKFINASFNTYKDEGGQIQGIVIVFQDITKHMRLDNMRKEFVANVSHELRTPLTTIKGYAETLLEGAAENPQFRDEFLEIINSEADRMTAIIRDLLELSRFDDRRMEFDPAIDDLVALAHANVQNHKINAEKHGKEITFISDIKEAPILMDSARINQVFNNIISNSLRYSQAGAAIQVSIAERAQYYMVYISDDGIGIPKEDLRMIFERFYRVDKTRSRELGGTGLGLSIAKEIMEAHGGRIHAASELNVGTTMTLRFPKIEEEDEIELY